MSLAAISCSNLLEQNPYELQTNLQERTAYLKVSVGSKTARTVMPVVDEADFTSLVLKGTKSGSSEKALGSWENLSAMQNAAIPVTSGSWTFTLTAKKGGTSLSGSLQKEITLGENSLSFNLSINDIGNGDGSFSITLNFAKAENADRVTKALATLENTDGSEVEGLSVQPITPSENAVTFSASGIAAGTYRAKVVVYGAENGTDFELATYRELVQISSGLASTAIRAIESFDSLYTITYNLNDGALADGATLQETVTRKSEAITLPILTRNYYTFDGWFTDENFAAGTEVTRLSNFTDNVSVYAKFTPVTFTITYVLNGGTNADGAVTTYTVEDDVTLIEPTNGDNAFGGFFESEDFTGEPVSGWTAGSRAEEVILYVKWDGIKATQDNIVDKINNMTESGIIKARGEFTDTIISNVKTALKNLVSTRPDVLVSLDFSEANLTKGPNFAQCNNLEKLVLPDTITAMPKGMLQDCTSLKELTIPFVGIKENPSEPSESTVFGYIFGYSPLAYNSPGVPGSTKQQYKPTTTVVYRAEYYIPSSLKKVTVKKGKLPYGAFSYCSIKEIILENVETIDDYAFYNCEAKKINMLSTISNLGTHVFDDCSYLEELTVNSLSDNTLESFFENTIPSKLSYITVLSGQIPDNAFKNCTKIKTVLLDKVTSIGSNAFEGCSELTDVTILDNVLSIGTSAFYDCSNLKNITLPDCVTSIGASAFYNCSSLENITLPDSLTSIGASTFYGCNVLANVILPSNVTSIGASAFYNCSGLESITLPDGLTSIGDSAFFGCSVLANVILPGSLTSIGASAFYGCSILASITLPDSLTSIGASTFYNCSSLESITLPDSITKIESSVFYNCSSLNSITLPDSLTGISTSAFYNCSSLESITLPDSLKWIGASAFCNCSSLTSFTIPDNVTTVGESAFEGCKEITEMVIGSSVKKIGKKAFYSTSKLYSVVFKNTSTWYYTNRSDYTKGTQLDVVSIHPLNHRLAALQQLNSSQWYFYKL